MSRDPKVEAAMVLVAAFAEKLLALNDGKAIPRQWKNALLKAIKPAPQKRGRKADNSILAAVSKQLTLNRHYLAGPDRTKRSNRGEIKKSIANSQKISVRSVERIAEKRRQVLDASRPFDETMRPYIDGLFEAIGDERRTKGRTEKAARFDAERRKYGIRTFAEWKVWAVDNFAPHDAIYFDNRRIQTRDDLLKVIKEMEAARKSGN